MQVEREGGVMEVHMVRTTAVNLKRARALLEDVALVCRAVDLLSNLSHPCEKSDECGIADADCDTAASLLAEMRTVVPSLQRRVLEQMRLRQIEEAHFAHVLMERQSEILEVSVRCCKIGTMECKGCKVGTRNASLCMCFMCIH